MGILTRETRLSELWEELLEQKPTNEDLRYIIRRVELLIEKAQKLLKRSKREILDEMRRISEKKRGGKREKSLTAPRFLLLNKIVLRYLS